MSEYACSTEPGLIAKLRVPLDGKRATTLAALVIEYPEHEFVVEQPFLVMREAGCGESL